MRGAGRRGVWNETGILDRFPADGLKVLWRAPVNAPPIVDPLTSIIIPAEGTLPTKTPSIGIAFTETMKGHVSRGWLKPDDYVGAEKAGQKANSRMEFTLTITMPDLDAFLVSAQHAGKAVGTVMVDGFTPAEAVAAC